MNPIKDHNFANDPNLIRSTLEYELKYRKEGYTYKTIPDVDELGLETHWVRDYELDTKMPDVAPNFQEVRGTYEQVSTVAVKMNEAQMRSGFIFYTFFPEVLTPTLT